MTGLRKTASLAALVCLAAAPVLAQMVVPTRVIRSRSVIAATDLAVIAGDHPGAVADLAAIVGKEARVALYPGRPVRAADIGEPAVVERNQIVRMTYRAGALVISADGRALDRGGVGDRVRVMNLDSRTIVSGRVMAAREIEVTQ